MIRPARPSITGVTQPGTVMARAVPAYGGVTATGYAGAQPRQVVLPQPRPAAAVAAPPQLQGRQACQTRAAVLPGRRNVVSPMSASATSLSPAGNLSRGSPSSYVSTGSLNSRVSNSSPTSFGLPSRGVGYGYPSAASSGHSPASSSSPPARNYVSSSTNFLNPTPAKDGTPTVVCFGDSLTVGINAKGYNYPGILEDLLQEGGFDLKVRNTGINGDGTEHMVKRIPYALNDQVARTPVKAVLILGGINDLIRGGFYCSELLERLEKLYQIAGDLPGEPAVGVLTMPPAHMKDSKEKARIHMNEKLREKSKAHPNRFLVDLADVPFELAMPDGLHYSPEGYKEFARRAFEAMVSHFGRPKSGASSSQLQPAPASSSQLRLAPASQLQPAPASSSQLQSAPASSSQLQPAPASSSSQLQPAPASSSQLKPALT